ncbi:acid protease [Sporormia fimetaria CBS 119925]|uniref:Acid protease n=1 Tax=Sporormia fimetaria CBS 119925 TaxID=1340428 RepID=A0A6A6UXP3_9PLEO|nr:acid protease [Sporormia fimetaria CBS 119925]
MVHVTIGDSPKKFLLLIDSAASNTWLFSNDCKTEACEKHNSLGEGDSSSLKTEDTPFSITYGTGSVSGQLATDTIHLGSLSFPLTFGLATNATQEFNAYPMDGILGLGRGNDFEGRISAPRIMDALSTSNLIDAKLYGIHLNRASDGAKDGELNFGQANEGRYDGDVNWIDLVSNENGMWEISVEQAGVGDKEAEFTGRSALIDTGTSFMFLPPADAASLHALIPGAAQYEQTETYSLPCDTKDAVWIAFNGQRYAISTKDFVGDEAGSGLCWSKIYGRQTFEPNQWLVGDVFLKNVYTVFDFDGGKVGFGLKGDANRQDNPSSTTTTSGGDATQTSNPSSSTKSAEAQVSPTGTMQKATEPGPTGAAGKLNLSLSLISVPFALVVYTLLST